MGNQQGEITLMCKQVLLSGKLGDGCVALPSSNRNAYIRFNTINDDYLALRREILEGSGVTCGKINHSMISGYTGRTIPSFTSYASPHITNIYRMTNIDAIKQLDKIGLVMLFLDDGSLVKRVPAGHLYVNSFSDEELVVIVDKIFELYPYKRCSIYQDRKKDGRSFPYLYIPKITMIEFLKDVQEFLLTNKLKSLYYKGNLPSTTKSERAPQ